MTDDRGSSSPGLRERKKLRTRTTLIDVAAELCLRQGYEQTTVEQISAAADVSPRTFSRYFATKESVIAAMVTEIDEQAAEALAAQPRDITEHEAFMRAHLEIFRPDRPSPAFARMAVLTRIVNTSHTLNPFDFSRGPLGKCAAAIALRMGVPLDHPAVRLVLECGISLLDAVFRDLGGPGQEPMTAPVVRERLLSAFEMFTRTWQPWNPAPAP
ncbi:MAG TPA: TetR family transcriptional regulator [Mycobacterium sp.]|nr:TetR family transcriptional regulator [Mycobacterium sp.]